MKKAVVSLGTNLGNRKKNLSDAIKALNRLPGTTVAKTSCVYETEPWGYTEQPNFLNMCAEVETGLMPEQLLGACLGIEAALGRERTFKNAPRIIDIDLLLYENFTRRSDFLTVPHPLMRERAFVLVPLAQMLGRTRFFGFDFSGDYESADKSGVKFICEIDSDFFVKNTEHDIPSQTE